LGANVIIGQSRNENEWDLMSAVKQMGLQLDPAHGQHSDIRDHARSIIQVSGAQEFLG
jgi:hypothetical protein